MKSCVIKNIPNSKKAHDIVDQLRGKGVRTRKRGRGARKNPGNAGWGRYGYIPASGGEYQDLPMFKAARFSMYFDGKRITYPRIAFNYLGERSGKPLLKLTTP